MGISQTDIDALLGSAADLAQEASDQLGAGASGAADDPQQSTPSPQPASANLGARADDAIRRVLSLKVPVIVRLAESEMSIEKALDLTVGSIVEFDRPADSELSLIVKNVPIGTGNAVKCGENFGLRVISIEKPRERANAILGG